MGAYLEWNFSRRSFLAASAGLVMPKLTWFESRRGLVLCWSLDDVGNAAQESVSRTADAISSRTGHAVWVGKGRERALRLDGYSVWINHVMSQVPLHGETLTLSAWLTLESYPVSEAAVIELGKRPGATFRFAIDRWGYLQFGASLGSSWSVCSSDGPVPRSKWTHLAATVSSSGEVNLYQNAVLCGRASASEHPLLLAKEASVTIAKSSDSPIVAGIFPTGVLNGLIKDVRVFDDALSQEALKAVLNESKPDSAPDLQINGPWCVGDKQRPVYHALPPRAWTNEPHGLIHWRGQYHLFYQKNANGPYWGNINWGHMTSPDLYQWTEMPVAISPEPGPDAEGCWSGSVVEHDGQLALVYTGADGHKAAICFAFSTDGVQFTKFHGNPVIPAPPQGLNYPEFRDPFVWREGNVYYMVVGSAVKDVGGAALLYRSEDFFTWHYLKPLLIGDKETSGIFWEMPIFVKVGDKHVLIVCEVPGRSSYWVGTWNNESFEPMSAAPQRLELFNHLLSPTPCSNSDGRVVTMGIIPDQRDPKETWIAGWAHLYSLPRTLSLDSTGHLQQRPLDGINRWSEALFTASNLLLNESNLETLKKASGARLNVAVTFKRGESQSVSLLVRRSADSREQTEIRYEWEIGRMVLDRSQSSLDPLVRRDSQEATYWPAKKGTIELNVFLDESVIEVFVDDRAAFASRIYPSLSESDGVALGCVGRGAEAEVVKVARIKQVSSLG